MIKRAGLISLLISASLFIFSGCGSDSKSNVGDIPEAAQQTSLSIVYVSTEYDASRGMVAHYRVHAVNQDGNPISGLHLSMSIINGVKKIGGESIQYNAGTISPTEPISFHDYRLAFTSTNVSIGDTLMVLPSNGRTEASYLGDWKISGIGEELRLADRAFNLEVTDGLTYIVGNKSRLLGRDIAVAHIADANSSSVTDAKGFTNFDVIFDPKLAGHTVTIGAHTSGNRMGIASIETLRWDNFVGETLTVPLDGGIHTAYMTLAIDPGNGGLEHLVDVDIVPSSIILTPEDKCSLSSSSNLHTNAGGAIVLVINTVADTNGTGGTCEVKWQGGASSIYYEY